jgi:Leucine-rich repeat (LRR) protein
MSLLPTALLRMVGEYAVDGLEVLSTLRSVDEHFEQALAHPLLVSRLNLTFRPNLLLSLGRLAHGVHHLRFDMDTTDEDLRELSLAPSAHHLDFSDCYFVTGEGFSFLPARTQTLNFSCCRTLNDAGLRTLSQCTDLTSLDLSGCTQFTDAGFKVLSGLPNLLHLNLSGCSKITDAGAQHMCHLRLLTLKMMHCHRLVSLNFLRMMTELNSIDASWCTSLVDNSLQDLSRLRQLGELKLRGCYQLSDLGLQHLASTTLHTLNLCGVVCVRSTAANLPRTIRELHMSHCDLVGPLHGVSHLVHLHDLRLDDCYHITDADLNALRTLTSLRVLDLSSCHELSDLSALAELTDLRELSVAHNARVHDLTPLRHLRLLQTLSVQGCNIDDEDVWSLSNATELVTLNLRSCAHVTDRGLQGLAALTKMRTLDLHGCRALTDQGLKALAKMQELDTLILSDCEHVLHLEALTPLTTLRVLKIDQCALTDQGLHSIGQLPALNSLSLTQCPAVTDAGLSSLHGLALQRLDLESMDRITNQGVSNLIWTLLSLKAIYVDRCRGVDDMALPWHGGLVS